MPELPDVVVNGENLGPLGDSMDVDDSFGFAAQVGADWVLNDQWLINFDLRYITIEADVTVDGEALPDVIEIDPWVYSISVGFRF